jgi:hypothetical protein
MNTVTEKIDVILQPYLELINEDIGYVNHTKRMLLYALELEKLKYEQIEKFIIAASFHDLGIWTENSFDYLKPSIELARYYLQEHDKMVYEDDVIQMIDEHHKQTPIKNNDLAELFRKADLIDVSWGLISFGIDAKKIQEIKKAFPNNGFHKTLIKWAWRQFKKEPYRPMPMLKW